MAHNISRQIADPFSWPSGSSPLVSTREPQAQPILGDVQGHVLEKHRRDCVANLLLRFTDAAAARSALASLAIPSVIKLYEEGTTIRQALVEKKAVPALPAVCFAGISWIGCKKL